MNWTFLRDLISLTEFQGLIAWNGFCPSSFRTVILLDKKCLTSLKVDIFSLYADTQKACFTAWAKGILAEGRTTGTQQHRVAGGDSGIRVAVEDLPRHQDSGGQGGAFLRLPCFEATAPGMVYESTRPVVRFVPQKCMTSTRPSGLSFKVEEQRPISDLKHSARI